MRISTKIISAAASVALIAGAGAMAAAPAGAAGKSTTTVKGTTVVGIPPAIAEALGTNGITLSTSGGASGPTIDGSTGYANLSFPVTGPVMDGAIHHKGVLSIASTNGTTLTLTDPVVDYDTSPVGDGVIKAVINGLPDWMAPYNGINGMSVTAFELSDLKFTVKTGKVVKKGKKFVRADVVTATGAMNFPDDQDAANLFNTALTGSPTTLPKTLFTPGMPFGAVSSTYTVTHTCKTKAACA